MVEIAPNSAYNQGLVVSALGGGGGGLLFLATSLDFRFASWGRRKDHHDGAVACETRARGGSQVNARFTGGIVFCWPAAAHVALSSFKLR